MREWVLNESHAAREDIWNWSIAKWDRFIPCLPRYGSSRPECNG